MVTSDNRRGEMGFTLLEQMVICAIALIACVSFVAIAGRGQQNVTAAVRSEIAAAWTAADGMSVGSGNGATIRYVPSGDSGTPEFDVYPGRPSDGTMSTVPKNRIPLAGVLTVSGQNGVAASGFTIFIDGFERATFGTWDGTTTTNAGGIPSCLPGGAPLVLGYGGNGQTMRLQCGGDSFQAYDSSGVVVPNT